MVGTDKRYPVGRPWWPKKEETECKKPKGGAKSKGGAGGLWPSIPRRSKELI